jgi:small subunit ribosomal protein S17
MAERANRKRQVGMVVSDKMQQTVVVRVQALRRHPMYGKTLRHVRTFKAHNEGDRARSGDTVEIMETRPLSKEKRWRVVRIVEKAK